MNRHKIRVMLCLVAVGALISATTSLVASAHADEGDNPVSIQGVSSTLPALVALFF
jgi:hypothetical protein